MYRLPLRKWLQSLPSRLAAQSFDIAVDERERHLDIEFSSGLVGRAGQRWAALQAEDTGVGTPRPSLVAHPDQLTPCTQQDKTGVDDTLGH